MTTTGPPKHIFVHAADHDCTHVNMRRCSRFWLYLHSCEHAQVLKILTVLTLMWTCAGAQGSDCTYTHASMRRYSSSWPRQGLQSTSLCMLLTMIALMWTCAGAQDSDCTYTHVSMRRYSSSWPRQGLQSTSMCMLPQTSQWVSSDGFLNFLVEFQGWYCYGLKALWPRQELQSTSMCMLPPTSQ